MQAYLSEIYKKEPVFQNVFTNNTSYKGGFPNINETKRGF